MAGALGLIGHSEDEKPASLLNLLAAYAGEDFCGAVAVQSALLARQKTGRGQYLDLAMAEGVLYMLASLISDLLAQGTVPSQGTPSLNGSCLLYTSDAADEL